MPVSVVIPARNAAGTLRETLASLQDQTRGDWEAVVVDDGSIDETYAVARAAADEDSRVRPLRIRAGGVSAARNVGLAEARHDLLLFLDADDLVRPTFLALLGRELDRDPRRAGAHCGWARLAPDGTMTGVVEAAETGDLYAEFARECLFPIHACLVRTDVVRAVGGFDPSLVTCEDWDLWLRIARLGRPFGAVPDVLALYRMRERSASLDGLRMLEDGLEVIARARREDPRVPNPAPQYRLGSAPDDLTAHRLYHACWTGGLVLGAGGDARRLLAALADDRDPGLDSEAVAHTIFVSSLLPSCLRAEHWPSLWPEIEDRTTEFLADLETLTGTPALAARSLRALERIVLAESPERGPTRLGSAVAIELEITEPLTDLRFERGVDRLHCRVTVRGDRIGAVELSVCDRAVPLPVLKDAIASELAWPILERFLEQAVYPVLFYAPTSQGVAAYRGETFLADGLPVDESERRSALHDAVGWTVLLQELFALADWAPHRFYEWQGAEHSLPSGAPEARRAVEVSMPLPSLQAPEGVLDVVATIGGSPIGLVRLEALDGVVPAGRLVPAIVGEAGFELARLAVREAILSRPLADGESLRERLEAAARAAVSADPAPTPADALLLLRRRPYEIGGAASRAVTLPAGAAPDLLAAAARAGEGVRMPGGRIRRAEYDPRALEAPGGEVIADANGWQPGREFFESLYAERNDPWDYTNPYESTKYEQTLGLVPQGVRRALEIGCAEGHFTDALAPRVDKLLAVDISEIAVDRACERCVRHRNIEYARLDLAVDPLPGGHDLVVCSELLYYLGGRSELDRVAAKLCSALRPGGTLVAAHAHVVADDPGSPGFVWDVPFGAAAIGEALGRHLDLEHEIRTPFYRIQRFRRPSLRRRLRRRQPVVTALGLPAPLPAHVASTARWDGMAWPDGATETAELPILMYHRVAAAGSAALGRYRLEPQLFDEHLRFLAEQGFRSVGFEEAGRALRARRPIQGRAVVLTFDDGCRDFLTDAWPLLRARGFGATLFVVTDRVGGTNEWDAAYGEVVDLLGWEDLRRLVREGVEIGSHTATHPHLTGLSPENAVRELARSRTAILGELGVDPVPVAYPYGDVDGAVRRLAGGVGYGCGVTTEGRRVRLADDPLALPRIEVNASMSTAGLAGALGLKVDR